MITTENLNSPPKFEGIKTLKIMQDTVFDNDSEIVEKFEEMFLVKSLETIHINITCFIGYTKIVA